MDTQKSITWAPLLKSVEAHRDRGGRFYKPVCLFAACQAVDEGKAEPERLPAAEIVDRFRKLVAPVFPESSEKGFQPFWHLRTDKAWECYGSKGLVEPSTFEIMAKRPKSEKQLRQFVEYAAVPEASAQHWSDKGAREELKRSLIDMLRMDPDIRAQVMAEYLAARSMYPSAIVELIGDFDVPKGLSSEEDCTKFSAHLRIERNQQLAKEVKNLQGTICKICGFDFEQAYGEVGRGYIEAHHLVPIAQAKGTKRTLDPAADFAVLCSNCHRMVHRAGLPSDLVEFRKLHLIGSVSGAKGRQ